MICHMQLPNDQPLEKIMFKVDFFIYKNSMNPGRVSNVWESPAGCIMLSYFVQMENGRVLPLLQYVVSLAVTEAIKDLCQDAVSDFAREFDSLFILFNNFGLSVILFLYYFHITCTSKSSLLYKGL